jgi:uncharacterized protein
MMSTAAEKSPFLFNCHELPRRAGEMREYELTFEDHGSIGVDLLAIPGDAPIDVDLRLEAVAQGVLATATVSGEAVGECTRCLEPLTFFVQEEFQELFYYEVDYRQKPKGKEIVVEDEDELLAMEGDFIDLDGPIRDALILNLPINPLCKEDCEGLCPGCGLKWIDLPDGHEHLVGDIRWAQLDGWQGPNS